MARVSSGWVTVPLQSGQTAATLAEIKNSVSWFAFQVTSHTVTSPITKSVSQPVAVIKCNEQAINMLTALL